MKAGGKLKINSNTMKRFKQSVEGGSSIYGNGCDLPKLAELREKLRNQECIDRDQVAICMSSVLRLLILKLISFIVYAMLGYHDNFQCH